MKKVMKFRRILQKSKRIRKRLTKKQFSRRISLKKKYLFKQIESPHNTNEYLINNQSSPFYIEDEEDSINIKPSSIILLEDDTNSELNIFNIKDSESTNDESMILNEKSENGKGLIIACLDGVTK
jgi:hypothetical protein